MEKPIKHTDSIIYDNKIIHFSTKMFINDIIKGDCCFICGADPKSKKFNDEHVIPDWILKKFKLYSSEITLPNGTFLKYNKYKIPCCKECNSKLGLVYEEPMSKLLTKSYSEIITTLTKDRSLVDLLFKWLNLLFFKTHLKDKTLSMDRDKRKNTGFIADEYFWQDFHQIHCIARSHYTNAIIDKKTFGTIIILPALKSKHLEDFDYIDNLPGKGVMLKIGNIAVFSILNDSKICNSFFQENFLNNITGTLNTFQIREVIAHLSFLNTSIDKRPNLYFTIDEKGTYYIKTNFPKTVKLIGNKNYSSGKFLRAYVEPIIMKIDGIDNKKDLLDKIESGETNYLFDEKWNFIQH